jgi:mannose-6-phosphate isomerase-like protein (cupin superfamily)
MKWRHIEVPKFEDARGNLSVIEGNVHVPFSIARMYYLYSVPVGGVRAGHAHKRLHQFFVALSGSFTLRLEDGVVSQSIDLSAPNIGLLVEPGVWRVLENFSQGAVCLVLASLVYDEADYIRDYDDFYRYVGAERAADTVF